ncbi:MAG: hypothetical protein WD468_00785 [Pirellulales bacterium]
MNRFFLQRSVRARIREILVAIVSYGGSSMMLAATPTDKVLLTYPITIAAASNGDYSNARSWYLSVNTAGQAQLAIEMPHELTLKSISVSQDQLNSFRRTLIREKFFQLGDKEFGEQVLDGSTQTLAISVGQHTTVVRIRYLAGLGSKSNDRDLEKARSAIRVFAEVRGWFKDGAAFDPRSYWTGVIGPLQK